MNYYSFAEVSQALKNLELRRACIIFTQYVIFPNGAILNTFLIIFLVVFSGYLFTKIPMTINLKGANLYLVGMMGAGKSTTGRCLAHALGYRFLDTDTLIEDLSKKSITDIFRDQGEAYFREIERSVLAEVSSYHHLVVATGGGIVLDPMNWSYLRQGVVVWLNVPLPILCHRLAQDRSRPLLQGKPLLEHLQTIAAERERFYAQADLELLIQPEETAPDICDRLLRTLMGIMEDQEALAE